MKYFVSVLLLGLGLSGSLHAQETYNSSGARINARPKKPAPKGFDKDKVIYGAGLKFNFFNGAFRAGVMPAVGYRVTKWFAAGVGLGYQYDSQRDAYVYQVGGGYQSYPLRRHLIVPSVWTRFLVYNNIFIQAEGEYDIQNWRYHAIDDDVSSPSYGSVVPRRLTVNSPALLIGPGLRQPIGEYSSLYVMVMYDVLQNINSPYYGYLDYRIGFNIGW